MKSNSKILLFLLFLCNTLFSQEIHRESFATNDVIHQCAPISNELIYQLMFEELSEQEQMDFKGKPLIWGASQLLFPDGSVKSENDI